MYLLPRYVFRLSDSSTSQLTTFLLILTFIQFLIITRSFMSQPITFHVLCARRTINPPLVYTPR